MGFDVRDFDPIAICVVKLEVFVEEVDKAMIVGDGEVNDADPFYFHVHAGTARNLG